MITRLMSAVTLAAALLVNTALAQPAAGGAAALGVVQLPRRALADGQPLAAGSYQVRATGDCLQPAVGQSPGSGCWIEFVRSGKVAGREVATVISAEDMRTVAEGVGPAPNGARVDILKGEDYVRMWINRGSTNYLIHLPLAR